MNVPENTPEIPDAAIDGFLSVAIPAILNGSTSEIIIENLDAIEGHEAYVALNEAEEKPDYGEERVAAAHYHLGQIAALYAFLDKTVKRSPFETSTR
jgi:hypothetical protein